MSLKKSEYLVTDSNVRFQVLIHDDAEATQVEEFKYKEPLLISQEYEKLKLDREYTQVQK